MPEGVKKADKMSKQLTVKQQAFTIAMYTPGSKSYGNGTESARAAGYKGNDNTLATVAKENTRKPQIIAEKQRIQAETVKETKASRDYVIDNLRQIIETSTNERNRLTAMSLLGDFTGDKREKAPNAERVADIRKRMTAEDLEIATIAAKIRTDQLASGPKLKKDTA